MAVARAAAPSFSPAPRWRQASFAVGAGCAARARDPLFVLLLAGPPRRELGVKDAAGSATSMAPASSSSSFAVRVVSVRRLAACHGGHRRPEHFHQPARGPRRSASCDPALLPSRAHAQLVKLVAATQHSPPRKSSGPVSERTAVRSGATAGMMASVRSQRTACRPASSATCVGCCSGGTAPDRRADASGAQALLASRRCRNQRHVHAHPRPRRTCRPRPRHTFSAQRRARSEAAAGADSAQNSATCNFGAPNQRDRGTTCCAGVQSVAGLCEVVGGGGNRSKVGGVAASAVALFLRRKSADAVPRLLWIARRGARSQTAGKRTAHVDQRSATRRRHLRGDRAGRAPSSACRGPARQSRRAVCSGSERRRHCSSPWKITAAVEARMHGSDPIERGRKPCAPIACVHARSATARLTWLCGGARA